MPLSPGDYLTDGTRLYRFECFLPDGEGVLLEDSGLGDRTLTKSMEEFSKMKLRQVKPLQKGMAGVGAR